MLRESGHEGLGARARVAHELELVMRPNQTVVLLRLGRNVLDVGAVGTRMLWLATVSSAGHRQPIL